MKTKKGSTLTAGISFGGTNITVCVGNQEQIVATEQFRTGSGSESLLRAHEILGRLILANPVRDIGIAFGSPLNPDNPIVPAQGPIPQLIGLDLRQEFSRYQVPVYAMNDAKAGALAVLYRLRRECPGLKNLTFLTYGTGNGEGTIANGQIVLGFNFYGGESGHMPIAEKPHWVGGIRGRYFEQICCGRGVEQLARIALYENRKLKLPTCLRGRPTCKEVFEAHHQGDPLARRIIRTEQEALGLGIATILAAGNPEYVVLGGIYLRQEKVLRRGVDFGLRWLRRHSPGSVNDVEIIPAPFGEELSCYQALAVAEYLRD